MRGGAADADQPPVRREGVADGVVLRAVGGVDSQLDYIHLELSELQLAAAGNRDRHKLHPY